jgi:hypothetical protein
VKKLAVARRSLRVLALPASLAGLAACDGPLLDLGTRDAGQDAAPPKAIAAPSCPFIASDSDYPILRGATCTGDCNEAAPLVRDLSAPDVLAAALTGAWTYCAGDLGPSASSGIEFFPGCVFFFLIGDAGVEGGYGTYDVVTGADGGATGIVMHLPAGDVQGSVSASTCLGRARFAFDGGAIDLASIEPPDAAVAK